LPGQGEIAEGGIAIRETLPLFLSSSFLPLGHYGEPHFSTPCSRILNVSFD